MESASKLKRLPLVPVCRPLEVEEADDLDFVFVLGLGMSCLLLGVSLVSPRAFDAMKKMVGEAVRSSWDEHP